MTHLQINVVSNSDELTRFTNGSYSLTVAKTSSEVVSVLNATSIYGAMRGLQTFSQLVKFNMTSATYTMFGAQVTDFPRFEYRGVMVDTSRNFVSLAELRIVCDLMEQNKLNALSLHLTDSQSWSIEIEGFPRLTQWLSYGNRPSDEGNRGLLPRPGRAGHPGDRHAGALPSRTRVPRVGCRGRRTPPLPGSTLGVSG